MDQKILRQVTLERANRKKDRSVSLTFTTSLEESTEGFMEIDKIINHTGILYFKSGGDLLQSEVDELDSVDIELEGKSKSKRLRNTLFVYWKQEGERGEFKDFYSIKMEEFIDFVKRKLD